MKILIMAICSFLMNTCIANSQYHEFEGISEVYNIRNSKALSEFLPANPVIIEAGAYQGRDTSKLAQKFPNAKIYAFEPLSSAFSILSDNVKGYKNVQLFNIALDATSGVKPFYVCHGTYGKYPIFEFHSSLLKPTDESSIHLLGPIESVPCISLQEFSAQHQIDAIDMLWLSTEGNELDVLLGMKDLLSTTSLVYVRSQLYPTRESITVFETLKEFMRKNGFILLSHFYLKDIHGDALFVRMEKI